jgi:hypothetical protein
MQGLWELSFNKDNTSPAPFALEGGSKVEVSRTTCTDVPPHVFWALFGQC